MQPIWVFIVLLCGLAAFNSAPSNVANAMASYEFRRLYYGYYYYRSSYYTAYSYTKYRYAAMDRLKMYYRAYTYSYNFGEAAVYHRAYSYAARLTGYDPYVTFSSSRQCGNFETNSYGDFIGFFKCPLFFEPKNFTYCCGVKQNHYCCSRYWKSNPYRSDPNLGSTATLTVYAIVGIVFGILLVMGIIGGGIAGCICCCIAAKRPQSRPLAAPASAATFTTSSGPGVGLQQPQPGQPWTAASYPNVGLTPAPYPQQSYVVTQPAVMIAPPNYDDCNPPGVAQPQVGTADPSGPAPPPYPTQSPPDQLPPQ